MWSDVWSAVWSAVWSDVWSDVWSAVWSAVWSDVWSAVSIPSGNALITVATGDLSDEDKERSGLVKLHAYAVLDVKEVLVRSSCHMTVCC